MFPIRISGLLNQFPNVMKLSKNTITMLRKLQNQNVILTFLKKLEENRVDPADADHPQPREKRNSYQKRLLLWL